MMANQPSITHLQTGQVDHLAPYPATGHRPLTPEDPRLAEFDPYQDPALATPSDAANPHERRESDGPGTEAERKAAVMQTGHPREGLAAWKWPMIQVMFVFIMMLMGYDVSNIANIQSPIYHAFGHVELLPWIAVGYSAFCCALMPQYTRLANVFGLKPLFASAQAFAFLGCVLSGAAVNTDMLIIGRALNGIGCAGVLNIGTLYNYLLATPAEFPRVQGMAGMAFGIGLILGPIVGGAFAENPHATWRWAIYINLPILTISFCTTILCIPPINLYPKSLLHARLRTFDWAGCLLHAVTVILACSVLIFSGSTWAWNSAPAIACWVLLGAIGITYALQQALCILTSLRNRLIPFHIARHHRAIIPVFAGTFAISAGYSVTLYYTPLFFAFARGFGPIAAAVRLLPFIGTFIVAIFLSSGSFPATGLFAPFYILGGAMVTAGSAALGQVDAHSSDSYVMGLTALIGFGVGLMWQLGIAVLTHLVADASTVGDGGQGRRDATSMFNTLQLGGVAIALSLAGCVFQNMGFQLLQEAVGGFGIFNDRDLREALAGLESKIWTQSSSPLAQQALPLAVVAVTKALGRVYYIPCAGGAIAMLAGLFMGFERIDVKKAALPKPGDAEKADMTGKASRESHVDGTGVVHDPNVPQIHGTNYSHTGMPENNPDLPPIRDAGNKGVTGLAPQSTAAHGDNFAVSPISTTTADGRIPT